jgi:O-antigen/teichoic acid export membrane protein
LNYKEIDINKERFYSRTTHWIGKLTTTALDQITYSVTGFTVSILLARWLSPAEFGVYALAFSALLFVGMFQNSLILEPMSIFGPRKHSAHFKEYLTLITRYQLKFTLGLCAFMLIGLLVVSAEIPDPWPGTLLGMTVAIPLILLSWLMRRAFYVIGDPGGALYLSFSYSTFTLISLFIASHLFSISGLMAFLTLGLGAAISAFVGWLRLRSVNSAPGTSPISYGTAYEDHWRYGRWLVLNNIPHWIVLYGYTLWAGTLLSLNDVGGLRAMQTLVAPVSVMFVAFSNLLLPWIVRRNDEYGKRWLFSSILLLGVTFGVLSIMSQYPVLYYRSVLDELVFRSQYSAYVWILPFLVAAQVIATIALAIGIGLRSQECSRQILIAYVVSALSIIFFGYPLIKFWGFHGLLAGNILSQFLLAFLLLLFWWIEVRGSKTNAGGEHKRSAPTQAAAE